MAVMRVKQNIGRESWLGAIATVGDPLGRSGRWLAGGDITYATSRFRGSRNLLAGAWVLATNGPGPDPTAAGFKLDYPNDAWDAALTYKRIGRDFAPALGFVPRPAVQLFNLSLDNRTRVSRGPLQQLTHEFRPFLATDLDGRWESYRVFSAPLNWRFRSGDRLEVNVNPTGERLTTPFVVADGVTIAPGRYHWRRYRLEAGTAQKRRFYTQLTWWFGGFYDGTIDQVIWSGAWNPTSLVTVEVAGERNLGRLPAGRFAQTLVSTRVRLNVSPDLSVASYVQYDTVSDSVGVNTRLRWTFRPVGRPVRGLQPQRALPARALAARIESGRGQAAVRLAALSDRRARIRGARPLATPLGGNISIRTWMTPALVLTLTLTAAPSFAQAPAPQEARPGGRTASVNTAPRVDAATMARPIDMHDSVSIENLTMLEVRDLIKAGSTTALVLTGGIEENGPYLTTGKHNNVLKATGESIARALGKRWWRRLSRSSPATRCGPISRPAPSCSRRPPTRPCSPTWPTA